MLAATFGLGTGYAAMALYTPSVIAPHLLAEFGWSKAAFAAVGTISLVVAITTPIAGRLADVIGVTRTVTIGMVALPASFVLYSLMTGPIWQYFAIFVFQSIFCITMTSTIYSRIAVQHIVRARGLALAIVAVGPTITGVFAGPLLNAHIEQNGWRETYLALAAFCAVTSLATLLLLPPEKPPAREAPGEKRRAIDDYRQIVRNRTFRILTAIMLLCNLWQVIALSQLKLLLLDNGVQAAATGLMLSAFPSGVLAGRFISGAALDRFPAWAVGMLSLGVPSLGMVLIASSLDTTGVLLVAVALLGFSFGAEGDIVAYIVADRFGVALFGSVMGLMFTAMSVSASLGALALSGLLSATGGFGAFLLICAAATVAGSLLFPMLRGASKPVDGEMG